ncbi:MAG: hypothetical protein AB7W37_16750 [Syntrophobacteraceae bacterium]
MRDKTSSKVYFMLLVASWTRAKLGPMENSSRPERRNGALMSCINVWRISLCFAGGALGALANSFVVWQMGKLGVPQMVGVDIAPAWTLQFLYPRIVWGGLWGFVFLFPVWKRGFWTAVFSRGVFFSLFPTAFQLFYVFPNLLGKGMLGAALGGLTPLFVFLYNAVWGFCAGLWIYLAERKEKPRLH